MPFSALAQLDATALEALHGRSMLLTQDWTTPEIETLCALAEVLQQLDRAGRVPPLFTQQLFWALFFDNSTRTKSSWAGAAARFGGQPVIVDGSSTQVSHGETAVETGAMLGMNAHALGIRHDLILGEGNRFMRDVQQGIDEYLSATGDERVVPIVNLQCDIDHPTQALADLLWLRERFPEGLAGRTITMSWAYSPSYAKPLSVAQGVVTLMTRFGAHVRLAHPDGYQLMDGPIAAARANAEASGGSFEVTTDMDAGFDGADVVYPKSWGPFDLMSERVAANRAKDAEALRNIERRALARNATHQDWICDERRMGLTRDGRGQYLHCLPADIGAEVSGDVMERFRVDLARQANKKVFAIMALLAVAKSHDLAATLARAADA
jgi:knotted carbamoyltransferase YgeW